MLFTAPAREPKKPRPVPKSKKELLKQRKQGLLERIRRRREEGESNQLTVTNVERYQIIARLQAIQALKRDPNGWARRKIQESIDRIERGEAKESPEKE